MIYNAIMFRPMRSVSQRRALLRYQGGFEAGAASATTARDTEAR